MRVTTDSVKQRSSKIGNKFKLLSKMIFREPRDSERLHNRRAHDQPFKNCISALKKNKLGKLRINAPAYFS